VQRVRPCPGFPPTSRWQAVGPSRPRRQCPLSIGDTRTWMIEKHHGNPWAGNLAAPLGQKAPRIGPGV